MKKAQKSSSAGTKVESSTNVDGSQVSQTIAKPNVSGSLRVDVKKVGSFLKNVDGAEYLYMRNCMGMRDSIQDLIKRHDLTKEDVCKRFKIKPSKYIDFIMGNYNYSVMDMACLNATFMELESEKLKEKVPVNVVASNDR